MAKSIICDVDIEIRNACSICLHIRRRRKSTLKEFMNYE